MTLVVIHDTDKQLAALVEPDAPYQDVPIMAGPAAATLLEQFVTDLPFDYAQLSLSARAAVWTEYVKDKTGRAPAELLSHAPAEPAPAGDGATPAADPAADRPADVTPATAGGAPADTDRGAVADPTAPAGSPVTPPASEPPQSPPQTETPASTATPSSPASGDSPEPPAQTETRECPVCSGSGSVKAEPDGAIGQCGYCNGTGQVAMPA